MTTRGVDLRPGTPFAAMDMLTPSLRAAFGFIGVAEPAFVDAQPLQFAREIERDMALTPCRARTESVLAEQVGRTSGVPALASTRRTG